MEHGKILTRIHENAVEKRPHKNLDKIQMLTHQQTTADGKIQTKEATVPIYQVCPQINSKEQTRVKIYKKDNYTHTTEHMNHQGICHRMLNF